MINIRTGASALAFTVLALPLFATSARTIHPELVGLKAVSLNISLQNLPGLESGPLEETVRKLLSQSGLEVVESAPQVLFVNVTYQLLPACPDFVAFRTLVAVSEHVSVRRGARTETVYVDTWRSSDAFVESKGKAGQVAHDSVVRTIEYMLDTAKYTESVINKK